uniref:Anoctamin n=1 Tax=Callorhinchus milii TaxID=7868 RepID=A0A4W3IMM7_CALMI
MCSRGVLGMKNIEDTDVISATVFLLLCLHSDFVLVWEEERSKECNKSDSEKGTHLTCLPACFVAVFLQHVVHNEKRNVHYILLSAPWNVLCYYAEELSMKVPLQAIINETSNWSNDVLKNLGIFNVMHDEIPNTPLDYYTCQFRQSKLERFLGSDDHDNFFSCTQRHQILYEILERTPYGQLKNDEIGINKLLNENVFSAAFPLHNGPFEVLNKDCVPTNLNLRQVLYEYWGRWGKWYKYQPLGHIRKYYGEKIAFYFAWLGFYTGWLLPAAAVGTFIFIVGIFLVQTDIPAKETCEENTAYVICPPCDVCNQMNLSSICNTFKIGLLFDNGGTVFFSVFMSLWAVTFLEYWKRKSVVLADKWDCLEFEGSKERSRPEFTATAPMTIKNPVTGIEEPYFPNGDRIQRVISSTMVILLMIAVVFICLVSIILYRSIVSILMYKTGNSIFMVLVSIAKGRKENNDCVDIVLQTFFTRYFPSVPEMHRTQTMYEDAFIVKVFIFQFVNFYSSPLYIAFFKGRFIGYPGHYGSLLGVTNEDCGAGGCMIQLAQELLVIMVGKQIINNVQEFVIPKLKGWLQKHKLRSIDKKELSGAEQVPWVKDYELLVCEGLFDEYLEMVLQFGFITIFVAAFPLAPLFALLNNWIEIRLDASKFVCEYRRPIVERAQDIGIWFNILEVITHLAVISNAFLIAFTSDFLPRLYYYYTHDNNMTGYVNFTLSYAPHKFLQQNNSMCRYKDFRDQHGYLTLTYWNLLAVRLGFVIVFEHVVFFIGRMIDVLVPDVPESVEIKLKREHYLAKQAREAGIILLGAEKVKRSHNRSFQNYEGIR